VSFSFLIGTAELLEVSNLESIKTWHIGNIKGKEVMPRLLRFRGQGPLIKGVNTMLHNDRCCRFYNPRERKSQ